MRESVEPLKIKTVMEFKIVRVAGSWCSVLWRTQVHFETHVIHTCFPHGRVGVRQKRHIAPLEAFMKRRPAYHTPCSQSVWQTVVWQTAGLDNIDSQ